MPELRMPVGKTPARLSSDIHQTNLKKGDLGYIDGYVQGADGRPYVVFVRMSDGAIDLALPHQLMAAKWKD